MYEPEERPLSYAFTDFGASIDIVQCTSLLNCLLHARCTNVKEATINRALDGSTYPCLKPEHSILGIIYYGGLKHNSLYFGLVLPSVG